MAEEINFEIGHFRNFDGPLTLTLTSDDFQNHMEKRLWEEILFYRRYHPICSIALLCWIMAEWLEKCNLGQFWSPIKRHVMGGIANIAYVYERTSFSLSNYTTYFFHDCYWFWSRLNSVSMHSGSFLKSHKETNESGSKISGRTKIIYCPIVW